jgi:transposase-like protein
MEKVEGVKKKRKKGRYGKRYGFEFKLRCAKLRLEEGLPVSLLSKEVGASKDVIRRWAKAYQERGEAGLRNGVVPARSRRKLPGPVREKIVEIKKREPLLGVKRISHLLKRAFFLSASPETVRRTLRAESLIVPSKKKKPRHNITRPRFFERSRPNQMWQSDIFTFRLGGRYAYLIGFIDDYSRYVVGLELYRSQTVDQVLEVYRRAVGEYGVAKEVLTDRGRQYTTWRGSSGFGRRSMRSSWYGRNLGVLRRPERGSGSGCSITTTSGLTRGLGGCALRIGTLRSRRSCARRWSKGSRTMSWRWPCGASPGSPFTWWDGWRGSRWSYGRRRESCD